jgi:hypothetical protein
VQIAALADIHGNVHALRAVLADPRLAAAGPVVVPGDVVASGQPSAERIAAQLVDPPSPAEWTAQWEALRSGRSPRLP